MARILETVSMPFEASEMFEVVNDVNSYPEFLPWCVSAEIISEDETSMKATIVISKGGFSYSLTTFNSLVPGRSISMDFSEGPFKFLKGEWRFIPIETGCQVKMELDFEAESKILDFALSAASGPVAAKLMYSFRKRAYAVWG